MQKRITVYCASSQMIDEAFFEAAARLSKILVAEGYHVVTGAGSKGLMGKVADTVLAEGGEMTGVIPEFMINVEWQHKKIQNLIVTKTMAERKEILYRDTDVIIALPGGCGTLEELFEVITLKRLGLFTKPILILNTKNYYAPLKEMLERCVEENFMGKQHLQMWNFINEPEEFVETIKNATPWDNNAIDFAVVR
jgi:uncharacterized protein (TIGR00730 family)